MKIIIPEHARQRFEERWIYEEELNDTLVCKVLEEGKNLNKSLLHTTFLLGYSLPGYWTAIYKIYKEFIFIFRRDKEINYILITLIPKTWLERKRKEMLIRYQKQHEHKNIRRKFTRKKK